ncbi:MAG: arylsulfatase [Luteolibacter sp.]
MNRLRITLLLSAFSLSLLTTLGATDTEKPPNKPNIIYILLDDAGYGDLGCYGQKTLHTPNVDRLAAEGMKFTRHYSGSTVCAPSRGTLMTGLHTGHSRIRGNGPSYLPDTDLNVASMLKDVGYHTACIGKYGLGSPAPLDDPRKKGFDYFFGYINTAHAHNFYTDFLVRNGVKIPLQNQLIPGSNNKPDTGVATADGRKEWAPQLLADDVQRYLTERAGEPSQPFFLYYALNLPHTNNEAGLESPLGHGMETPSYGEFASHDWPDVEKGFASAMKFIDDDLGAIMAKLKKLGLDENTIVMFSSDNGPHREGGHDPTFFRSSGEFSGIKRDLTDGGIRVPLLVRWPGRIKANSTSNHLSGFQDFLPTAADLAGVKVTAECDGISFLPTLLQENERQKPHDFLCWYLNEAGGKRAVLQWPWKLIHLNTDGNGGPGSSPLKTKPGNGPSLAVKLYNLDHDTAESNNVANAHPEIVQKLTAYMNQAWREPKSNSP